MESGIKTELENLVGSLGVVATKLDAYVVELESRVESQAAELESAKAKAAENEARGRKILDRLMAELRGSYGPRLGRLYGALMVAPDFGGLTVYVPETPELNHYAVVTDGKVKWDWGNQKGAAIMLRLTRKGLDGLLRWERNDGVEILQGEDAIMRLWALQDETALQALLRTPSTP